MSITENGLQKRINICGVGVADFPSDNTNTVPPGTVMMVRLWQRQEIEGYKFALTQASRKY